MRGGQAGGPVSVAGADVLIAGLFSAKETNHAGLMSDAAAEVTAHGARVVGQFVQRRGVSDGGVRKMGLPYSSRTLMSHGKVREIADARKEIGAGWVVFVNELTEHQRRVLSDSFGCPAISVAELKRI